MTDDMDGDMDIVYGLMFVICLIGSVASIVTV